MKIYLALAALAPAAAMAGGPFDGTWKTQSDSVRISGKPEVYELKDGMFKCGSCAPPVSVKADGADQKVAPHGYYDTVAVRVVDAHTVELTNKLAGKATLSGTLSVAPDGSTLTETYTDTSGSQAATFKQVSKRAAAGPAGSHAISGSWNIDKVPELSDTAATVTYKMTADGFQMQWNGESYDAKFDGKKVLTANDPGKTWVSLKKISNDTVEETDSRGGKVTDVIRMTVSSDGKTMSVVDEDKAHGTTMQYKMSKQP
jgi:hypothetical protein